MDGHGSVPLLDRMEEVACAQARETRLRTVCRDLSGVGREARIVPNGFQINIVSTPSDRRATLMALLAWKGTVHPRLE